MMAIAPWFEDELIDRATGSYYRRCERDGLLFEQPTRHSSGVEDHDGKRYVVLRGGSYGSIQAVCRYNQGIDRLRFVQLGDHPQALKEEAEAV